MTALQARQLTEERLAANQSLVEQSSRRSVYVGGYPRVQGQGILCSDQRTHVVTVREMWLSNPSSVAVHVDRGTVVAPHIKRMLDFAKHTNASGLSELDRLLVRGRGVPDKQRAEYASTVAQVCTP